MNGRKVRITTVDRIAVTATFAVAILIVAVLGATAHAESQTLSEVAPLAVPPTVSMPDPVSGHRAPTVSLTGRRY